MIVEGRIDETGHPLLELEVRSTPSSPGQVVPLWIDTAFTGEPVLPDSVVEKLSLPVGDSIRTVYADGREAVCSTFRATIEWFGEQRAVEVISTRNPHGLLGLQLLLNRRLILDFRDLRFSMD